MLEDIEKTVLRAPFAPTPRGLFTGSPSLSPRPPYFVTNRTSRTTIERVTRFTTAPGIAKRKPSSSPRCAAGGPAFRTRAGHGPAVHPARCATMRRRTTTPCTAPETKGLR